MIGVRRVTHLAITLLLQIVPGRNGVRLEGAGVMG